METKIETTNEGGKVLAYDGDQLVGQLDFAFQGNVLMIEHTRAFVEGVGVGALLVNAANNYAINHFAKSIANMQLRLRMVSAASTIQGYT